MNIETKKLNQYPLLLLKGKFRISEGDIAIKSTISKLMAEGQLKIFMDISQVKYLDSSAIGEIVAAHTSLVSKGGRLVLIAHKGSNIELFTVTKLISVLDIAQTEEEALAML